MTPFYLEEYLRVWMLLHGTDGFCGDIVIVLQDYRPGEGRTVADNILTKANPKMQSGRIG